MRVVAHLHSIFLRMSMVYYTYSKSIVYLCIYLFKWQVCCQLHVPIWALASQYLWLSDVEDKAVHLNKCCWSISSDHRVCNKDREIFLCDVDVLQGISCPESRRKCVMASLLGHLVVFTIECFHGFFKSSYCKSQGFHHHHNPSECGFGSVVWSKWPYLLRHQLFCFVQFHSGLGFIVKQLPCSLSLIFVLTSDTFEPQLFLGIVSYLLLALQILNLKAAWVN